MYTPGNEITIKSLNLPQKRGFKRCTHRLSGRKDLHNFAFNTEFFLLHKFIRGLFFRSSPYHGKVLKRRKILLKKQRTFQICPLFLF